MRKVSWGILGVSKMAALPAREAAPTPKFHMAPAKPVGAWPVKWQRLITVSAWAIAAATSASCRCWPLAARFTQ